MFSASLTNNDTMENTRAAHPAGLHNDFRAQVEGGWENVHPAVRARMDRLLGSPTPTTFEGTGCVRRSRVGWCFAQLSRMLGSPLVFGQGEKVTTTVEVAPTDNGLRCWHRHFAFEDGSTQLVQTTKVVDPRLGLLDAVGKEGEKLLATRMRVWTEGRSLHFMSTGYLLRFRFRALRLPSLLTPGTLYAEHRDEGDGWFRYILRFHHPLWGETFYQDGMFRMVE